MKPLTPQELSIGNLLNYDTGEGIEFTVIDWQDLKWLQEEPDFFNNHFSPVPLTPEILEGFKFEEVRANFYVYNSIFVRVHIIDSNYQFSIFVDRQNTWDFNYQIHTHTLQNFIHAISGVQLVYKPKTN